MSVPLHRIHRLKKKKGIFFFNFCEFVRVKRAKKTKSVKLQRAERETLTCCLGAGHWSSLLGLLSGAFHTAVKKSSNPLSGPLFFIIYAVILYSPSLLLIQLTVSRFCGCRRRGRKFFLLFLCDCGMACLGAFCRCRS